VRHPEHDRLISLALGEPDDDASAHVAECASCRAELATLRQVVAVGAETQSLRDLPEPPPRVWERIEASVRAASVGEASVRAASVGEASVREAPGREASVGEAPVHEAPVDLAAERRRRRDRRGRRGWPAWATAVTAAAAAAVVAVAATLAIVWSGVGRSPDEIVASAALAAFGETPPNAHGEADVLADGRMRLEVRDLPPVSGYYQVWLIDPKTMEMFPLGVVDNGSDAQLPLPSDVDLARYSVVDVSAERFDNNPAHSGDSLLRGELT
jgi:anti-sigma-K factor RskA